MSVEVTLEGEPSAIAPAVEIAAYRIIQESLTNVVKHTSGAHAQVRIRREPSALLVEVADDGPQEGAPRAPRPQAARGDQSGGQGIVGMRERVALLRGSFEAGPVAGGGFQVRASLPLEPAL